MQDSKQLAAKSSETDTHHPVVTTQGKNGVHQSLHVDGDRFLLPHHYRELCEESGLSDETIRAAGIYSEENKHRLARWAGYTSWRYGPAIVFPYVNADGETTHRRLKPDSPPNRGGKPTKYLQPKGVDTSPYFPREAREAAATPEQELAITEGEKKALKLSQDLIPTIALPGVFNAFKKQSYALHPELEAIDWKGRTVYIVFDSDAVENDDVRLAEGRLAAALKARGANVRVVRLPAEEEGTKNGADDYLVRYGPGAMRKLLDAAEEPEPLAPEELRAPASEIDFAQEARVVLAEHTQDGVPKLRYHQEEQSFLIWQDGCWRDVSDKSMEIAAQQHLSKHYFKLQPKHKSGLVSFLQGEAPLPLGIESPSWLGDDEPPFPLDKVIALENGVLNVEALIRGDEQFLIPPTPRFFSRTAVSIPFNPDAAKPERFLQFLDEAFDGDEECIELAQLMAGYLLLSDNREQKIFLLVGEKRGGKGTFADVLRQLVGWECCTDTSVNDLTSDFGLAPLLGKSVCFLPDTRFDRMSSQAAILQRLLMISGDDPVSVNIKHKPHLRVRLGTRFVLLSNEAPAIYDASGAIASRMVVLPFQRSFYGQEDVHLKDKLTDELEGILLWAVDGVQELWKRRDRGEGFPQPEAGREWLEQIHDLASPIQQFVDQCCVIAPEAWCSVEQLFDAYRNWSDVMRLPPRSSNQFCRELKACLQSRINKTRPNVNGRRIYRYQGIGLDGGQA